MSGAEAKLRLLKDALAAERRHRRNAENYLLRYFPEVFVQLQNHQAECRQRHADRLMDNFNKI